MKKMLSLVLTLTVIAGVCAAVLTYVNGLTYSVIDAGKSRAETAARAEVMCGERGYAVEGRDGGGYGGEIVLMVGFREDRRTVISYKVLAAAETPGLGMKLKDEDFCRQFAGKDIAAVKLKSKGGEIEAITAATITSKAVCRAIADAARRLNENPDAYRQR